MSWSDADKKKVVELFNAGFTAAEIGRDHFPGKSRNAVAGILHRMQEKDASVLDLDPTALWTDRQSLRLLHLRENEELSWPKIASALRKSKQECTTHYRNILHDLAESEKE